MGAMKTGLVLGIFLLNSANADDRVSEYQPLAIQPLASDVQLEPAADILPVPESNIQLPEITAAPSPETKAPSPATNEQTAIVMPPSIGIKHLSAGSVLECAKAAYSIQNEKSVLAADVARYDKEKAKFSVYAGDVKKKYNHKVLATPSQYLAYKKQLVEYNSQVSILNAKANELNVRSSRIHATAAQYNKACENKLLLKKDIEQLPEVYRNALKTTSL